MVLVCSAILVIALGWGIGRYNRYGTATGESHPRPESDDPTPTLRGRSA